MTAGPAVRELRQGDLVVPWGRKVDLRGRGRTFVRESGRPNAPTTVLLVHGWLASAGINWASAFEPLGESFRVIAPDLRGHGRGIRSFRPFRLEDCADDLAALLDELGCGPVIVAGYSMGGLVAQLLWRRRPDLVAGLVLCSTAGVFVPRLRERYLFGTSMNVCAGTIRVGHLARWFYAPMGVTLPIFRLSGRPATVRRWAMAELLRHDIRQLLEAGYATCHFDSSRWITDVDVPAAVIVTTRDRAIPPTAQRTLAAAIDRATVYELDDDHLACTHPPFGRVLLVACRDVADRAAQRSPRWQGRH